MSSVKKYAAVTDNTISRRRASERWVCNRFRPAEDSLIVAYQGPAIHRTKPRTAAQKPQLDYERASGDLSLKRADEPERSFSRTTGGEQIVHNQHAAVGDNCILMDLERVHSVLQLVLLCHRSEGKFARLARDCHPDSQAVCDRGAHDKSARFDPQHDVDRAQEGGCHVIHGRRQRASVGQQRGDVLENDSGLGKVGNVANEFLKFFVVHTSPGKDLRASSMPDNVGSKKLRIANSRYRPGAYRWSCGLAADKALDCWRHCCGALRNAGWRRSYVRCAPHIRSPDRGGLSVPARQDWRSRAHTPSRSDLRAE